MARKSRKQGKESCVSQIDPIQYDTAIYVRLSVENGGNDFSDTLENQIHILQEYVNHMPELKLTDTYCDNGFTGMNFSRPEFRRMMDDMKKGKINCIVVKDLSRLGRNFIETGNYIERIFPFFHTRFISVGDHYDSLKSNDEALMVAFKNLMNEFYSRDISAKILSSLRMKQREGKYLSGPAPFGYIRDENNKYHLKIDKAAAAAVQKMYEWKKMGKSNLSIAKSLNAQQIPPPSFRARFQKANEEFEEKQWTERTIKWILQNPVYLGMMISGKTKCIHFKQKKRLPASKDQWMIVEHTHEPIIAEELFYQVSQQLEIDREKWKRGQDKRCLEPHTENPLSEKAFCGYCGALLHRSREKAHAKEYFVHYLYRCRRCSLKEQGQEKLKSRPNEQILQEAAEKSLEIQLFAAEGNILCQQEKIGWRWIDKIIVLNDKKLIIQFDFRDIIETSRLKRKLC